MIKVKVRNESDNPLPKYETDGSACMDVRSDESLYLTRGETIAIETGLYFEIPEGWMMSVRPRSGLAVKHGVTVLNTPGTIDSDYRGELKIILHKEYDSPDISNLIIEKGDRIAQIILEPVNRFEWEESEDLSETERGSGGFGSTG